jgi:lipid-A-disaccharide synthase
LKKVYVIAGEASGDMHGANLIRALGERSIEPLDIYGVGGGRIQETGAKDFYDLAHFHVTGLTAAIKKIPEYKKAEKIILANVRKARPDLVVLIDNPGFNLILARQIHAMGIPIVYYIAPQVWAWNAKRVFKIKEYVKKVLVVFQFEKKFFESHGVPVSWVGHPLKDMISDAPPAESGKRIGRLVTLMPGSRKGEIKSLFNIFLKAASKLRGAMPGTAFAVIKAPTLPRRVYDEAVRQVDFPVQIVEKYSYDVIRDSELVIACSGTATLECAVLGTPVLIANRGSLFTYLFAKAVVKVDCLGLPNLILGQKKFPELLQYDATPDKIAKEAVRMLTDKAVREDMKRAAAEVSRLIGDKGASTRAAEEILALL